MQNRLALVFILVTVMIDSIGIGIIFPVMPDLMREVTGADLASASLWGGLLATSFAAMQFLCGPIVGNLSDRYGRRPVMLIALMVMALDYAIMAVAQSVWLLLLGRLIAAAFILIGLVAGATRGSLLGFASGVGAGLGIFVAPRSGREQAYCVAGEHALSYRVRAGEPRQDEVATVMAWAAARVAQGAAEWTWPQPPEGFDVVAH